MPPADILVRMIDRGQPSLDGFVPELYDELRRMAHGQLAGERDDHTLSTTALVHEAYLKLAKLDRLQWKNRSHFCAEAARAMRRILVDYAVRRGAKKRGGDRVRVEFRELLVVDHATGRPYPRPLRVVRDV